VTPPIAGLRFRVNGSYINIDHDPATVGKTYSLQISREVKDQWGQSLSGHDKVRFSKVTKEPERKHGALYSRQTGRKITLDPFTDNPEFLVQVTNYEELQLTAYDVSPQDWSEDVLSIKDQRRKSGWKFKKIATETLEVKTSKIGTHRNKPQPLHVSVGKYFQNKSEKLGQVLLVLEPTRAAFKNNFTPSSNIISRMFSDDYTTYRPIVAVWLQRTRLGLDIIQDNVAGSAYAWVTDLCTGAPVDDAKILLDHKAVGNTDSRGLLKVSLGSKRRLTHSVFTVDKGSDVAFARASTYTSTLDKTVWHIFNDRGMYKPNEKVTVKGYVRRLKPKGDAFVPEYITKGSIKVTVYDPRGSKLPNTPTEVKLNAFGAFNLEFTLPDNVNLGGAYIDFRGHENEAGSGHHPFQIQEFRTPEFRVSASHRPVKDFFANPVKADWEQLRGSEAAAFESRVANVVQTFLDVTEHTKQLAEEERERKLIESGKPLDDVKAKTEAELKAEREKEKADLKAEEKNARENLAPPEYKFAKGDDPCVIASVQADYFAGGGLSDARIDWQVTAKIGSFTPPKHSGFTFGTQRGWYWQSFSHSSNDSTACESKFEGKTDSKGHGEVAISWSGLRDDHCDPLTVTATANVMDLNMQARSASTSFLVHPCRFYVGFKMDKPYGEADKPLKVSVVVVDPKGERQEGVQVRAVVHGARTVRTNDDQGLEKIKTLHHYEAFTVTSAKEPATITIIPPVGGSYTLHARVADEFGGWHQSKSSSIYISDPKEPDPGAVTYDKLCMWQVPMQNAVLIPDKKTYNHGDTAVFMVRSPFAPAQGVFCVDCDGIKGKLTSFEIKEGTDSAELKVAVTEDWIPGFTARVRLSGTKRREPTNRPPLNDGKTASPAAESLPLRPAAASASVRVDVSRQTRSLDVQVVPAAPEDDIAPGKKITSSVTVKDFAGNPVPGVEVCLVMVDEAVLSLSGHSLSSPLHLMYPTRRSAADVISCRTDVFLMPLPEQPKADEPPEERLVEMEECRLASFRVMKQKSGAGMSRARRMSKRKKCKKIGRGSADESDEDDDDFGLDEDGPIAVRKNFNPLAAFVPSATTDAKGQATFEVNLPDNLTSYRVWAMAASDLLYGLGESTLSVSLPLMVRPSPPRFLNFSDKCSVSVVLQNQTAKPLVALIAARATNATMDPTRSAAKVTLAALQRGVVHFGVEAKKAGIARLQFVSSTKGASDAAEVSLPVFTPATSEGFATYGSIDVDGQDSDMRPDVETDLTKEAPKPDESKMQLVVQPIKAPKDVWPQFGGLEISTSTTQLQHLTDAVVSLHTYSFECSEQLASRILGMLSVVDVLAAFKTKSMPTRAELEASVKKSVNILKSRQHSNGGFWTWGPPQYYSLFSLPSPYMSVHVSCCLAMLEEKKFAIPSRMKNASLTYIRNIESRLNEMPWIKYWSPQHYNLVVSFALYARTRWGDKVAGEAAKFIKKRGIKDFSPEARARILVALSKDGREHAGLITDLRKGLEQHMTEEADTAYFTMSYDEVGMHVMLASNRKTDAVMLEALVAVDGTKNQLSPKLCKGLLKHKLKTGGWGSTQENCWVLVALLRYFHEYEKNVPDFVATLWYGSLFGGKQEWKGRSTETKQTLVAMKGIQALGDNNFMIHKEGKGRLYYRIGMVYAPLNLRLEPANYGFQVSRTYEPAGKDDASNVVFDEKDKVWRVKLGERVKITVKMITTARRYHVALVDFLPAGLEPINPALKGSPKGDDDNTQLGGGGRRGRYFCNPYTSRYYSKRYWPEHINLRDERAEAFRSLLWPGIYEFVYTARATTAGEFVAPPAKAEEMYSPEQFGRSATEKFVVS